MSDQKIKSENINEAISLADDILKDIELSARSLSSIALKTSRLARLINDFDLQQIMLYESGGYPSSHSGVQNEIWDLLVKAKRIYTKKEIDGSEKEFANIDSIDQMEIEIEAAKDSILSAKDGDISISSANPNQFVSAPMGNKLERQSLRNQIKEKTKKLAQRRTYIYEYVTSVMFELKYTKVAGDIFYNVRSLVDENINDLVPDAVRKFSAIYDYLLSENSEDWSNAVHSCRRILQDTADVLYPERKDIEIEIKGKKQKIKLGKDQYINRLIQYISDHSDSERFEELVGSHLKYIGERLDSIFKAAQKGSHSTITTIEEANRYVIYTYLIVGDLLSLVPNKIKVVE